MKQIQIHYVDKNGNKGVINYLSAANVAVSENKPMKLFGQDVTADIEARRTALKATAQEMAGRWSMLFPDDQFMVVEV